MPYCHLLECAIPFRLAGIPMQLFPVIAQNFVHRIAGRQCHPYAEGPLDTDGVLIDEVVLMAVFHARSIPNCQGTSDCFWAKVIVR